MNSKRLNDIVIVDAGPLIALSGVELLELPSKIFRKVWVTDLVMHEVLVSLALPGAVEIAEALKLHWLHEKSGLVYPDAPPVLGSGEWSAICLAQKTKASLLLDDKVARKVAHSIGISVLGTCGLLVLAKRRGYVRKVKPLINQMIAQGYYISDSLARQVVKMAGER